MADKGRRGNSIDEQTVLTRLGQMLRTAQGWDGDAFSADRKTAYDYYFMRPRGDEKPGGSAVVSGDLSAAVDSTVAQIVEAFTTDAVVEFMAEGEQDEDQARLESDVVQEFVMHRNNGFLLLCESIKECLLARVATVKIYVDDRQQSFVREYRDVEKAVLPELIPEKLPPNVEVDILSYDESSKILRVRETVHRKEFRCDPVPNILLTDSWHQHEVQNIPFIAEPHHDTRSHLIERGYPKKKVNKLPPHAMQSSIDNQARNLRSTIHFQSALDPSQELVQWFECYVLLDIDGDGIAERCRFDIAGSEASTLLHWEPVPRVPYALGTAIINPYRLIGISLHDKLRQNQDENTFLKRERAHNIVAANRTRLAHKDGAVNVEDLDNPNPDASIRVRRSERAVADALMTLTIPDMTQGILSNIEALRKERTELAGASLELAAGNLQISERLGSEGLDRAYSVMEQFAALMTRTIGATLIRSLFVLAHDVLRTDYAQHISIRRQGRWVSVNPAEWPRRYHVDVKPGASPNERARKAAAYNSILERQTTLAQQGMNGILTDLDTHYLTLVDWCRSLDIRNPERYWMDPLSGESRAAQKSKKQQQQREEQMRIDFMRQAVELEKLRSAFAKYQQDTDLQFRYWDAVLKSQVEEAKITGTATVELIKAREAATNERTSNNGDGSNPSTRN